MDLVASPECLSTPQNVYRLFELDGAGDEVRENLPENAEEEDDYAEYIPIKKRRMMEAQKILQRKGNGSLLQDVDQAAALTESKPSLLVKASQLKKDLPETTQQRKDEQPYLWEAGAAVEIPVRRLQDQPKEMFREMLARSIFSGGRYREVSLHTRENVASHLQKYRLYLNRLRGNIPEPRPVASFQANPAPENTAKHSNIKHRGRRNDYQAAQHYNATENTGDQVQQAHRGEYKRKVGGRRRRACMADGRRGGVHCIVAWRRALYCT